MLNVHIAISLHHVFCIPFKNRAQHIFHFDIFCSFAFLLGKLKHKYIICLQINFYTTIEPYIYITILPIAREEVRDLVPKIIF